MKLLLKNIVLPLTDFSLEVNAEIQSRVTVVFGPSGAGKTSLLELVAGLRPARSAFIQLDERVLTDTASGTFVPVRHRGIGYVPQDLALFPHLSVRQNLAYGHRPDGTNNPLFAFDHIVEVLEIQPLVPRGVNELSGGERQRVALARALLTSPRLLLLDEPLASLDAQLKSRIIPYLTRVRDEFGVPMLYVTHDRYEALSLADEVFVLAAGRVAQSGLAQEVFSHPANLTVAGVVSVETIQPGRIVRSADGLVTVAVGTTLLSAVATDLPESAGDVFVCIRAEDVSLQKGIDSPSSPRNHLPAIIQSIKRQGPLLRIDLDCGFPLAALLTQHAGDELGLKINDPVVALIKAPNIHLISR